MVRRRAGEARRRRTRGCALRARALRCRAVSMRVPVKWQLGTRTGVLATASVRRGAAATESCGSTAGRRAQREPDPALTLSSTHKRAARARACAMCHMECCCRMWRSVVPRRAATNVAALCRPQYAEAATGGTATSTAHSLAISCARARGPRSSAPPVCAGLPGSPAALPPAPRASCFCC